MNSLEDSSRIHALLKDKTRRRIISMLGEQERVGFKEFRDSLKIGVGTLYYHLDVLSDFVSQDKNRKYVLNERGRLLYRALSEGTMPSGLKMSRVYQNGALRWLFLTPIFNRMSNPIRWLPLSAAVLVSGAVGAGLARLDPLLLFYTPTIRSFEMTAASFLFCWLGAFFLVDFLAYVLYRRSGDDILLFVSMGVAALPSAAYPYLYVALTQTLSPLIITSILRGVLLVLQVWSLILLTSAFSYGKGLRLERAAILSLSLLYTNITLLIVLGNLSLPA